MNVILALLLSIADLGCFFAAVYIYFWGSHDAAAATFWLAMSISSELGAWRAWRRVKGIDL